MVKDNEIYNLKELIQADFNMEGDDPDFAIRHDELIKVCKILLHKFNYIIIRNSQDQEYNIGELNQVLQTSDNKFKSLLEEVNQSV